MTIRLARGCAYGDENDIRAPTSSCRVGGIVEASPHLPVGEDRRQAGLVDWNAAGIKLLDLLPVYVDAGDMMAASREACSRNQAHITRTDHCDLHSKAPCRRVPAYCTNRSRRCFRVSLRPDSRASSDEVASRSEK